MNRTRLTSQKGMTLIELMISIGLSFLIVTAMIALFVNTKQSYRLNDNVSRLQENARFAMTFLTRDLRMADYRQCVTDERLANALEAANNSGTGSSDVITIRWQSNDCTATDATQTIIYSIQTGASGQPALFRKLNNAGAVEVVEGIENLQITIGEDTDDDFVPNYYVDAPSIADLQDAVSVRLSVVARTMESNMTASGNAITRTFNSVVTLRNRVP